MMGPGKNALMWVALLLGVPGLALAKVSGPCVDCHTMHNSQAGVSMAYTMSGATKDYTGGPNKGLLNTDCVGCHQGVNSGGAVPYVFDSGGPTYGTDTLAGGNFYWVSTNDRSGHNVVGLAAEDFPHGNLPPGSTDPEPLYQLTCAGTYGCHGDRGQATDYGAVSGAHHGQSKAENGAMMDGSDLANSYRMLLGLKGIEDSTWEKAPTDLLHNQYYGIDRSLENTPTVDVNDNPVTISALCAECHGHFHANVAASDSMESPWIRHPTDFDMYSVKAKEFGDYGGSGVNAYQPSVPLASNDLSRGVLGTVLTTAGDAIVMCLSCHRAHGSPYGGILRWDYKNWPAPGVTNGCIICHTAKD